MPRSPNRELLSHAQRLRGGDGDFQKCFHLYHRFHAGDDGSEVLADDFVIFSSVAEDIIALADFLKEHPECVKSDIYGHYSKLAYERKQDSK